MAGQSSPKASPGYTYRFPHPAVTADCVVFRLGEEDLEVLLVQRRSEPFRGAWALPGGFVGIREDLLTAARRELQEETGLRQVHLEQLQTFGRPGRDPRERIISVVFWGRVREDCQVHPASDAAAARWFPLRRLPGLAFDHKEMVRLAFNRLREYARFRPIGRDLLPAKFKLSRLQQLYEVILGRRVDRRNFRRRLLKSGLVKPLPELDRPRRGRPARLHRFDRRRYAMLEQKGFARPW